MRTAIAGVVVAVVVAAAGSGARGADSSADEAEVLKLDQRIADAVVRGDTTFVDSVTPPDFVMVHGDGWTNGGKPLLTDTEQSMLRRVTTKYYDVLDFDSVKAEMHGDVAITYGRYLAHTTSGDDPAGAGSRSGSSASTPGATGAGSTCRIEPCMGRLSAPIGSRSVASRAGGLVAAMVVLSGAAAAVAQTPRPGGASTPRHESVTPAEQAAKAPR